jgi:hypothetical protein
MENEMVINEPVIIFGLNASDSLGNFTIFNASKSKFSKHIKHSLSFKKL